MCGIAGFLGNAAAALLGRMAAAIAHRGPDGEGLWHDPEAGVGLAHRRLAIIDPTEAAAQPMVSCGGRYTVVFNGEIYNFKALARELSAKGYAFNTSSDTAVLGPLYDLHGAAMLARLNGIFAFAIWDRERRELLIARDALGIKPLYYTTAGGRLVFASELKALLCIDGLDRTLDVDGLTDYLVHLWSPGARTMLRSVAKLLPGHLIRAGRGGVSIEAWTRPAIGSGAPPAATAPDARALTGQLSALFNEVVSDQCISDVPIGAFLSGGVDSSAVVAAMVATGHRPAQTYCIGFDGADMASEGFGDDLAYAREVASRLDVPFTPIIVKEAEAGDIERLAWMLDEPQADPAALFVEAIAAAARRDGIKVLMSGAGGDDVFSGYRRHQAAVLRARFGPAGRSLSSLLGLRPSGGGSSLARRVGKLRYMLGGDDDAFLMRAFEFNHREDVLACLRPGVLGPEKPVANRLETGLQDSRGAHLLDRMLYMELHGFLPDHNLNYTDKASMAHGVEVRVPFLDDRMIAFARGVPWHMKVHGGKAKWLLKQSVAPRLPRSVLTRAKTGFGAPVRRWIEGRMRSLVIDTIASQSFRERGIFNNAGVERLVTNVFAGKRDGAYLVLTLVVMELWMRRFVDGRDAASSPGSRWLAAHA